jgi:antitoxin component of MazEF toxin-antitoxin module
MEARIKIQKIGNDLGINIPTVVANGLSLREGLYVNVQKNGNRIIIEPTKTSASYSLTDMLSEITENNIHQSVETGMPTGNEIW